MDLKHFGDSYDIVKKSLLCWLRDFGPWQAHPMFTHQVTDAESREFSAFLGVELLSTDVLTSNSDRDAYFSGFQVQRSIFLDPDTGISLKKQDAPHKYVFGKELVAIVTARESGLALVFDQSLARGKEHSQVQAKLDYFVTHGIHGFAYVSHASFLVLGKSKLQVDDALRQLQKESRLPRKRFVASSGAHHTTTTQ